MLACSVSADSKPDTASAATYHSALQHLFLRLADDIHSPANHIAFTAISTNHN